MAEGVEGDDVLEALDELVEVIRVNAESDKQIVRRARQIRAARARGRDYRTTVGSEQRPLIVEILREHQDRLGRAGSRFRRAEARALRAEGMTLDEIAAVFGVTRQRVIALLRNVADAPGSRS